MRVSRYSSTRLVSCFITSWKLGLVRLEIVAQYTLIPDVVPFVKESFLASDHLVLVHLRKPFLIVALRVGEDSVRHSIVVRTRHIVSILILTIALHALHVKITSIVAIAQSINVV